MDWEEILSNDNDVNQLFGSFYICIRNIIDGDKHAPIKKLS